MEKLIIEGKDNAGEPRQNYADRLVKMTDEELSKEMESKIWLSAYAANNHRSDFHWHCDATWEEGNRRNKPELYKAAHTKASRM